MTMKNMHLAWKGRSIPIAYWDREGDGPTIVLVHGLGNGASNFEDLANEAALADHRLLAMDFPGSGGSPYPTDASLSIDDLADLLEAFVQALDLPPFLLVGASMGGLTALIYAERYPARVLGFVNVEGNLAPEDCMFSRLATPHTFDHFREKVFPEIKTSLAARPERGFHEHLKVLERADARAYYDYSFQLVSDSATGHLVNRFLRLPFPRYFVYGAANRHLSYLQTLRASDCDVIEIPDSDHFVFYDNPRAFAESLAHAAREAR